MVKEENIEKEFNKLNINNEKKEEVNKETNSGESKVVETQTKNADETSKLSSEKEPKKKSEEVKTTSEEETEKTEEVIKKSNEEAEKSEENKQTEKSEEKKKCAFLSSEIKKKSVTKTENPSNENIIFSGFSKIFYFCPEKKKPIERGQGDLVIEMVDSSKMFRIRMIRLGIQMYACNHYVEPNAHFSKHPAKNAFIWTSQSDQRIEKKEADKLKKVQTFICKFEKDEDAAIFEEKFKEAQKSNKEILLI